jgi:archaellum component FlaD/FlaE/archaellum component FlaC
MTLLTLSVLTAVGVGDPSSVLVTLTAVALLGLFGKSENDSPKTGEGDDLDDDTFGGGEFDDGFDEDDDFGDDDFDDFGGDDWGDGDEESSALLDIEDRLGEAERELATLSSSVNTIREENRQIGDTVTEMDETIRKLLDVYEIVTHGINPFVDDAAAMASIEDGFGLFDRPDPEETASLDDDVAAADASSFFDDDFDDFEDSESEEEDMDLEAEDEGDGGALSFEDLKAEYEAGAWDEEEDADEDLFGDDAFDEDGDPDDEDAAFDEEDETLLEDELAADEADDDEVAEADEPTEAEDEVEPEPVADFEFGRTLVDPPAAAGAAGAGGTYVATVPETYAGQYLLTELAATLVAVGGTAEAVRAAHYYEDLGWIAEPVRRALCEHVLATEGDETGRRLTATDHLRALGYLSRLAGDHADAAYVDLLVETGGSHRGIRG